MTIGTGSTRRARRSSAPAGSGTRSCLASGPSAWGPPETVRRASRDILSAATAGPHASPFRVTATPTPRLLPGRASAEEVARVLCEAFADYPVMRYVLGDGGDYPARLRTLIGFFHGARVLRDDAIIGVHEGGELLGVALCSLPDRVAPPAMDVLRERTWAALGADARARYDDCVRAWEPLGVAEPNVHLNMLAVPAVSGARGRAG